MSKTHLVILKKQYIDLFLSGHKTIESRFTKTRKPPYSQVDPGDLLYFKIPSGPAIAAATVEQVFFQENLTPQDMLQLRQDYNHQILAPDDYWQEKATSNYASLIWCKDIRPIQPFTIPKKDSRAWIVCNEKGLSFTKA